MFLFNEVHKDIFSKIYFIKGLTSRIISSRQFSGPLVGGTRGWRNETPQVFVNRDLPLVDSQSDT